MAKTDKKPKADDKVDTAVIDALTFDKEELKKPGDKYVPEGFDDLEAYFDDLRETYALDVSADDDNRKAALEDKKFAAGEQWDPTVLQQRAGLPCLTINTVPQFVAQLVGDWRENKNAVKVVPSTDGDKDIADIRSDLIRAIQTKCRADRVFDNAFESMVQCGDAAFRVAVQYTADDVFDQEILLAPIEDCLSVVWDRMSIDPTGRDANHCFVDDLVPTKEFNKNWKDADPSNLSQGENKSLWSSGWLDKGVVRVTEHWRMIERKRLLGMFQDGTMEFIDGDSIEQLTSDHGPLVKSRLAPCRYAQMHLVTGYKILAGPYEYRLSRLPIIRMSGRTVSIGDRRVRYGLVRFMKDAARLRNFWRSIAAEQLGYAPKAQWLATESAVEGREDAFRKAHLSRDPLLVYNDDAEAPQRIEPPVMQTALLNEAQVNTQDMKDVTGIHDASLGIKSNETSGRAIMARQREGDVASLTYYDNGNASILEAGDVVNQLIGQIYDGTRIIRVIGEDEATKLVNINDPMDPNSPNLAVGTYDVAITTGASYTTRRVEAAEAMMDAIQVYPQLMQIAGDLVVKAQDWPGAEELAERLVKTIPPQLLSDKERSELGDQAPDMQQIMQAQQEVQQAMQQAQQELAKLQQENMTLKIKADIEAKKLEIEEFRAETERITAYAAMAKAGADAEIERREQEADQAMAEEQAEHGRNMDIADRALQAHDQDTQAAVQQQQLDHDKQQAERDATDRDTLTQLKIRQLSGKLNSDSETSTPSG
jgi:hypothetical protein